MSIENKDTSTKPEVPIWRKAGLSIAEASAYSNIGEQKLRQLTDEEDCPFVLWVGSRRIIKRKAFIKYISRMLSL